jgi:hypothetical protein
LKRLADASLEIFFPYCTQSQLNPKGREMDMAVITTSRQFGVAGTALGERLSLIFRQIGEKSGDFLLDIGIFGCLT